MTASLTKRILTKQILAGGALLLALAAFDGAAARAQTPGDTPPAPTMPAPTTSPDTTTPTTTTPPDTTATAPTTDTTTPSPTDTTTAPDSNNPASSSPKKRPRFRIGPEVGVYLPTSSKARSEFGSTWLTVGLGIGSIGRVTPKGQTSFDLQILYQSRHGNHAFLAPVGIGYRTAVSQSGGATVYVGATADLYLADLRSGVYNVHSGLRTGFGGSGLVGVNFGDSGFLEARYLGVSRIKGFDLSGLNVTAGYRF